MNYIRIYNEIVYLKKYIIGICGAPHAIGNVQVKV